MIAFVRLWEMYRLFWRFSLKCLGVFLTIDMSKSNKHCDILSIRTETSKSHTPWWAFFRILAAKDQNDIMFYLKVV